jgi:hypothetical protein
MRLPGSQSKAEEGQSLEKVQAVMSVRLGLIIDEQHSRVTDIEEKLDRILSRLSSDDKSVLGQTAPPRRITPNSPPSSVPLNNANFEIPFKIPVVPFPNVVFDGVQDVISKGYVSYEQAEVSLQAFRSEAYNFPFVVVDPTIPIDILRRKRPFLLLSILMFAAQWSVPLQSKLEEELKESLGKRVIMNGEKSLDLLQGLLVYLNWQVF